MIDLPSLELERLLTGIDPHQPSGVFDDEDETFQSIEHEMVKLGGLQSASIDWSYVDEASRQYLATQCKHFRIVGHLMTARLITRNWRNWTEAAMLLAGFVVRYWETAEPKPGPRGYITKRKLVALLIERMGNALEKLDQTTHTAELQAEAQKAFDLLQAHAQVAQLDVSMLSQLEAKLQHQTEELKFPDRQELMALQPASGMPLNEMFFLAGDADRVGDERKTRRTLISMAEFINEQDSYDPTGYQLRRFALWGHLRAAPPARRDHLTELMCVPVDTEESYREAIANNAVTPVLLQRVEKSLTSSPYWTRGSYFAASIAHRLEMPAVAEAIRHATERFLLRVPGLAELRFADGRPFVDSETLGWIGAAESRHSEGEASQEYQDLRQELVAQLDTEGVEPVLRRLQEHQANSTGPRLRCHATVIAADMLRSRGLSWLAEELYANAVRLMQGVTVDKWEPELFEHLSRHVDPQKAPEHGRINSQGERK